MNTALIIFPHQLFKKNPLLEIDAPIYLVEEHLYFNQYKFHKQKLALHRASMKFYENYLIGLKKKVQYIEAQTEIHDIRLLIPYLESKNIKKVLYIDTADFWLEQRITKTALEYDIQIESIDSPLFLNSQEELNTFFKPDKKKYFQTKFYIAERKKRNILLDGAGNPLGGKWSYDAENRKKYPKSKLPPTVSFPKPNSYYNEACLHVAKNYASNPGSLSDINLYPNTFEDSTAWLNQFLSNRFNEFGTYEDAIVAQETILNHSVLTPMLNIGLLTPDQILSTTLSYTEKNQIPINSVEGFIRQIIGWREFIRGIYIHKGVEQRTKNFWGFKRKIPPSFYDGTTGIDPIDIIIKKLLTSGYNHHIERLMVLGNFMLLCEFDPNEVYKWFMEMYIDAYDWVMVPNVYGMSQFADGGLMSTKPYISGSNYLKKMSDFPKGPWQKIWDGLFWRFMHVNRSFFLSNPRLGMLVRMFDKMPEEKQDAHMRNAQDYLDSLDS